MNRKGNSGSVIVLLSGGIDSTACVHYYLSQQFETKALFIDYDQPSVKQENLSAKQVASHYSIQLDTFKFSFPFSPKHGEIKGRNSLFAFSPLLYYPKYVGIISLGIHSGTPYYDCSEAFVNDINKILAGYTNGQILLDVPFLRWSKEMIFEYCKDNEVPIHLTYSCENSGDIPCGRCRSCLDRSTLDVG